MDFNLILVVRVAWSQPQQHGPRKESTRWNADYNGAEDTYMQFTAHWKKEIITWAKDCISEIKNTVEQINWVAADDLRHSIGMTMGRILEMHRQQVDMYRRMKRVAENRFTWLRPELAGVFPQMTGQNGIVEPGFGHNNPKMYTPEDPKGGKRTSRDYKPHVYILALEYITKRETEIEHLVKILTTYTAEEEVARFKPNLLPDGQSHSSVWQGYSERQDDRTMTAIYNECYSNF